MAEINSKFDYVTIQRQELAYFISMVNVAIAAMAYLGYPVSAPKLNRYLETVKRIQYCEKRALSDLEETMP